MQTNLLWTGRAYYSLENCLVNTTANGSAINSVIIGTYNGMIYKVEYRVRVNQHWETLFLEMRSRQANQREHVILESDGKGNWMMNGKQALEFTGCTDIDIAVTPFTNTLPINRLKFAANEVKQVQVIYFDVLQQQIKSVRQQYTRISDSVYQFENVPNDFEANIVVDENGFVIDYPGLFVRKAALNTDDPIDERM